MGESSPRAVCSLHPTSAPVRPYCPALQESRVPGAVTSGRHSRWGQSCHTRAPPWEWHSSGTTSSERQRRTPGMVNTGTGVSLECSPATSRNRSVMFDVKAVLCTSTRTEMPTFVGSTVTTSNSEKVQTHTPHSGIHGVCRDPLSPAGSISVSVDYRIHGTNTARSWRKVSVFFLVTIGESVSCQKFVYLNGRLTERETHTELPVHSSSTCCSQG